MTWFFFFRGQTGGGATGVPGTVALAYTEPSAALAYTSTSASVAYATPSVSLVITL